MAARGFLFTFVGVLLLLPRTSSVDTQVLYDGEVRNITISRLHGETWFDASARIRAKIRNPPTSDALAADDPGPLVCADGTICSIQLLEDHLLDLESGCHPLGRYAVPHSEHGALVKCPDDSEHCLMLLSKLNPPLGPDQILAIEPDSPKCAQDRTRAFRAQFYVVSKEGDNSRGQFVRYQLSRWMDKEDAQNAIWITAEPTARDLDTLRRHEKKSGKFMTISEASCTWKHLLAYRHMIEHGVELAVVMEDNVSFIRGSASHFVWSYGQELSGSLDKPATEWDIVFDSDLWGLVPEAPLVHGQQLYPKEREVSRSATTYRCPWHAEGSEYQCTVAVHGASKGANFYILPLATAKVLNESFLGFDSVIDHRLNDLIRLHSLNTFWAQPPNVHKVTRSSGVGSCGSECQFRSAGGGTEVDTRDLSSELECENCRIRAREKQQRKLA